MVPESVAGGAQVSSTFDPVHPLLACIEAVEAALKATADVQVMFMAPAEKRTALVELTRVEALVAGLRLRVMAVSDDLALAEGARDVAALVTHHTRTDPGANRRDLALAQALDRRWTRVADAIGQGEVNVAQAQVICHALDELPADTLGPEILAKAEACLVAQASEFGPRDLRHLGRRILDVVAPEVGEQHEAEQLAAEERRAEKRTCLVSQRLGDGSTRITIHVPDAVAARLDTYLEAFTSPRHQGSGEADRIPIARKRGQAFCDLLEVLDPRRMPVHGGDATTVIVTIAVEDLRRELGAGELGPVDRLTAGEVRRLACTANLLPAVLGGRSEVLDLGRSSRLFRPAQRKAMIVRDRECRAEGCTIPAAWCEAHHWGRPWARGGRTDLADGILLCSWHHHRAHDDTFDASRMPNGDVRFHRRT
jgi:hypothetical protein